MTHNITPPLHPNATKPSPKLSHAEICALPAQQRAAYVEEIRITYPRWLELLTEIHNHHQASIQNRIPKGMLLVGPTGAGKTTVIDTYQRDYPAVFSEYGLYKPVVCATLPQPITSKGLPFALLEALGDPLARYGTAEIVAGRAASLYKDCKVQLLILDEAQHLINRDSSRIRLLTQISTWLVEFLEETCMACLLVGLQGEAERLLAVNPRLEQLFGYPFLLEPFKWDEDRPESTVKEFIRCLRQVERMIPLKEPSRLYAEETAWRCFVASGGIMGYLMALIREATHLALKQGQEHLNYPILATAFSRRLAGRRRGIPNPFIT